MSNSKFDRGDAASLASVETAYVDALVCIDEAERLGLRRDATVKSTAPAVLLDPNGRAVQADVHLKPKDVWALDAAFTALQRDCVGAFDDEDMDLIAGRYATLEFQVPVGKAALLQDSDFETPVAIIQLTSSDPELDGMIRSPLCRLLAQNPDLTVLSVPIDLIARGDDPRAPSPSLLTRLRFSSPETLAYRMVSSLAERFNLSGPRGNVFIIRENELCKEAAWSLFLKGYMPRNLSIPSGIESSSGRLNEEQHARLGETADRLVKKHIGTLLPSEGAITALCGVFRDGLTQRVERYRASLDAWKKHLDGRVTAGRSAVLTNWVNDTAFVGLKRELQQRDVPMIFCQHGVTNEFNWRLRQYEAQFGTSLCDLELVFNRRAVEIGKTNPFRRGRSVATGFPKDYTRATKKGRDEKLTQPIWYICTAFYVANHGQLEGTTDLDKCHYEMSVINDVLARLEHRVLFKPYPGRRFEDPDPVETAAEAAPNVDVYRERLDLRYIVGSARVLISARSFSTPSWCLATGKPLVHIDIPDQDPLDEEAKAAFDDALFLFNAGDPDFHDRLRDFLNRPIAEIEREWQAKSEARKQMIETYIASYESGAGPRAAEATITEIKRQASVAR